MTMAPPWPSAIICLAPSVHTTQAPRTLTSNSSSNVLDRGRVPGHERVDRRVRDDVVEPAAALRHLLHHGGDRRRIAHVGDDGKGFAAGLLDQAQRLGRVGRRQLVDPDQRAVGGQAHRRGLPDASGGPGDERHLAREAAFHGVLRRRL